MSFMFNPLPYDDMEAINYLPSKVNICANFDKKDDMNRLITDFFADDKNRSLVIDGYIGADFESFLEKVNDKNIQVIAIGKVFKSTNQIEKLIGEYLPNNLEDDPSLIFGKLCKGSFEDFIDTSKLEEMLECLEKQQQKTILYGHGSAIKRIRNVVDGVIYIDVTPKEAVLRAGEGAYRNIGDVKIRSFNEMMRRYYYIDVEIMMKLRKELIQDKVIDYYVLNNKPAEFLILKKIDLYTIFNELAKQPFRTKPIYLEGIWGGEYIRKIRNIPKEIAPKIAWIFEFIPLEASIAVEVNHTYLDIPFYTFLNAKDKEIMGASITERFDGNFPIRFNYDDTWHSNGNMSIQVHPDKIFAKENYNEVGGQDEAYYVVNAGHHAKIYSGFKKDAKEFIELCKQAQKDGKDIDYEDYVYSVSSYPGRQVMIPAKTIHASGRNQFVLELGSFTVGAYTYKMYDYNRRESDGSLRPIHLKNAASVLAFERDGDWVHENTAIEPILLTSTSDYQEYLIGKTDLMYYQTHQIDLVTHGVYEASNENQFSVISIVDGEAVVIRSKENKELCYEANYLDVVTIPANINEYVIEAKGYQPVVIHKTILCKEGDN